MFLSLWHYLHGYVIVEVSGFNVENFLNIATHHGIVLWNVHQKDDKIIFSIAVKDFKSLKSPAKKTRSRLKIIKKKGLPFITYRYKKRKWFVAGIGLFIIMLWILSSFIWLVEIEGNSRLNSLDLISTLEENGYASGKLKGNMNLRKAETLLLRNYPDIMWVGISYEGTRMVVRVAESVLPPNMSPIQATTQSLISKRDALITYIAVEKGNPLVKAGDIVKKGDMLVSGEMPLGEESEDIYATSAKAHIKGKTIYTVTQSISLQQVKKNYTQQTSKRYSIKFFNKRVPLFSQKQLQGSYDQLITLHQLRLTKLFPLPFGLEVQTNVGYQPSAIVLSKEEAEDNLLSALWQEVSNVLDSNATVLSREAYFKEADGVITGTLYVVAEEEIAYPIATTTENLHEGEMIHE